MLSTIHGITESLPRNDVQKSWCMQRLSKPSDIVHTVLVPAHFCTHGTRLARVVLLPTAPVHKAHIVTAVAETILAYLLLAVCWRQRLGSTAQQAWLAVCTLWSRHNALAVAAGLRAVTDIAAWAGCKQCTAGI
jgi:hypothetical protein